MIPLRQAAMFIAAASTLASLANAETMAPPIEQVSSTCNPRLVSAPTFYPTYSSRAAAGGTALLDVTSRTMAPSRAHQYSNRAVRNDLIARRCSALYPLGSLKFPTAKGRASHYSD